MVLVLTSAHLGLAIRVGVFGSACFLAAQGTTFTSALGLSLASLLVGLVFIYVMTKGYPVLVRVAILIIFLVMPIAGLGLYLAILAIKWHIRLNARRGSRRISQTRPP